MIEDQRDVRRRLARAGSAQPETPPDALPALALCFGEQFYQPSRPVVTGGDSSQADNALRMLPTANPSVAVGGGRWSDLTGMQNHMTEPLKLVMDAMRDAGLTSLGRLFVPGFTPVDGYDGVRYAFGADIRAIGLEQTV